MASNDLRRSQVVVPFGVGNSYDYVNYPGMTMTIDHWDLDQEKIQNLSVDNKRFIAYINYVLRNTYEGPSSRRIKYLVEPPIAPDKFADDDDRLIMGPISVRKFPLWGVCMSCSALAKFDPQSTSPHRCHNQKSPKWKGGVRNCGSNRRGSDAESVRFISFCSKGHIQDLPWIELMSVSCKSSCDLFQKEHTFTNPSLYLTDDANGRGFSSLKLSCAHCGNSRNLAGIGNSEKSQKILDKNGSRIFSCSGNKPWSSSSENCSLPLEVQPRGATRIYSPIQRSAIFIPDAKEVRHPILEDENVKDWIEDNAGEEAIGMYLQGTKLHELHNLSIEEAVELILDEKVSEQDDSEELDSLEIEDDFFNQEYETLCMKEVKENNFYSEQILNSHYTKTVSRLFKSFHQIKTLRSCTALLGFKRVGQDFLSDKESFNPARESVNHLPAFEVVGEGFFLNFGYEKIIAWLNSNNKFKDSTSIIIKNAQTDYTDASTDKSKLHPGYRLIHSFSHALMRQLSIECGYGLTEISERIYFSEKYQMAGLLIYTASSDAEGSLGGLVRMIKPQHFESLLRNAIENSRTCSNDPICSESKGQGHSGLNLAACHACSMVPDLACSTLPKNIFLDRQTLIGQEANKVGYFFDIELD